MSSTAVSEAFRKVFDNNSQEVVDICLAMFVCVDGRVKFLQRFSNSAIYHARYLLLKPRKKVNLMKSC